MLVRAVRHWLRGPSIRRVSVGLLAITLARAGLLNAQEPTAPPKTHTVKRGDTLWDIAKTYLGDPFLWPEIYRLNTDVIEDPHWIYPGEVLKLPGATGPIAAAPAAQPEHPAVTVLAPQPAAPSADSMRAVSAPPLPTVRFGEFLAAPWVDKRGGPSDWGWIIQTAEISSHRGSEDRQNFAPYESVLFSPPTGSPAAEHQRYLAYAMGPLIEDLGQIVIPTGIVEVTRSPRNGEAGVARVVKLFNQVSANQRLIPYDSSAMGITARPAPVTNGRSGTVRWIYRQPVLPGLQRYLVLDMGKPEGLTLGDQVELYQPRRRPTDEGLLMTPEISIAHAQVVRVTPFGATAIVTALENPKIEEGTAARVSAKMP